jgi:hypothetical protein
MAIDRHETLIESLIVGIVQEPINEESSTGKRGGQASCAIARMRSG